MKKIIYGGIQLILHGQIGNIRRQQDFTWSNAMANMANLMISIRAVFQTVFHCNNEQPKESQMSIKSLVIEFIRVLWHKFVGFLKNTALGQWIVHYLVRYAWRQLIFTRQNAAKFAKLAGFGAAVYLCWRYWDKYNGAT